ncbi:hypothetical protein [Pseudoalteromonas maricaloris]|uniref:hypothetical protein n=1 Tax=Pseudoalteromonas maricaloris TaxID=184924 RepID=UPI003C2A0C00
MKIFLERLLEQESAVSVSKFDWYIKNYQLKSVDYIRVVEPGKVYRNPNTGLFQKDRLTVQEYFQSLGIDEYFDPTDRSCLKVMQYRCINPWGYVGYQVGEELLIDAGYYLPLVKSVEVAGKLLQCPSFYTGYVSESSWRQGKQLQVIFHPDLNHYVLATDINRWQGQFTGKNGIYSFKDLIKGESQDRLITDLLRHNLSRLVALLDLENISLSDVLDKSICDDIAISLSGILSCCHLNGVQATADFLINSTVHEDQIGTTSLDYMRKFANYDVSEILYSQDCLFRNYLSGNSL